MYEVVVLLDFTQQKEGFLEKKTLSGLAWNSAKSTVSVVGHLAAELFQLYEKGHQTDQTSALQTGMCIKGWYSEHSC